MAKDEMVGWHNQLDGHEFEQALRAGDGQGSLACCNPQGRKELDTTELLNTIYIKKHFQKGLEETRQPDGSLQD